MGGCDGMGDYKYNCGSHFDFTHFFHQHSSHIHSVARTATVPLLHQLEQISAFHLASLLLYDRFTTKELMCTRQAEGYRVLAKLGSLLIWKFVILTNCFDLL
jgi:hypothetical protein